MREGATRLVAMEGCLDAAVVACDVPMILAFLEHIESDRSNTARTRNARLAAIHSFFRFLEYRLACSLDQACRIPCDPHEKSQRTTGQLSDT